MALLRSALLLLSLSVFFAFDDLIAVPSCKISGSDGGDGGKRIPDDFKVMLVADLVLKGSDAGFVDRYFRDLYTSKFLKKSLESLQPDMLVVLGDISAKGSILMTSKWLPILQQFQGMLGPFLSMPLHIVLGDRDIGECSKLDSSFVSEIASYLPGLNSVGCGAFGISNISFVSLNTVALLCGNNDLRFDVEKLIESEHLDLQSQTQEASEEYIGSNTISMDFSNFHWRQNDAASGSGPVILLHLPLHRTIRNKNCETDIIGDYPSEGSRTLGDSDTADKGPYDLTQTLPPNATEYIFHSLKPSSSSKLQQQQQQQTSSAAAAANFSSSSSSSKLQQQQQQQQTSAAAAANEMQQQTSAAEDKELEIHSLKDGVIFLECM